MRQMNLNRLQVSGIITERETIAIPLKYRNLVVCILY